MIPATTLEFFGDCKEVLAFYASIFETDNTPIKTYHDMPLADVFGITSANLDMVWQTNLDIIVGESRVRLDLSDSLLVAMDRLPSTNKTFPFTPVFRIEHPDESFLLNLIEKLNPALSDNKKSLPLTISDKYGILWQLHTAPEPSIFCCFDFDGFCKEVLSHYSDCFGITPSSITQYTDAPYPDKILKSVLTFTEGDCAYPFLFNDTLDSATYGTNTYDPNALLFYKHTNPILSLLSNDKDKLSDVFNKLTSGAKNNKPLDLTSADFPQGSLIDKFGLCWNFGTCL